MRLRQTWTWTLMVMLVLLDFITDVWMLPAPSAVAMESVDMTHTLTWRPLQTPCNTTVLYSVQFQGEFELMVLNGSWVDALDCQKIPHKHCDLTFDLGSDSDYNIRVRAQCGSELSSWSELSPTFNRRHMLTEPKVTVTVVGDVLQVSLDKLPLTAVAHVTVWRKDNEQQAAVYTVPAEQMVLQLPDLQEGAEYCVTAQTVLHTQQRSSSTEAHCVSITGTAPGPDVVWKTPTTVTATVLLMAGLLFAVFWSIVHCRPDQCQTYFQKEQLPHSLEHVQEHVQDVLMSPLETEHCEQIHIVPSDKD
ncbi:cytokine receptor family member B16 isoform X2 [Anabas testudineus]|uniref:cytokine receptor family member B16 isoform X2 n=1 Tax=Anabas testudineus TaxID=64144 RepID=UPI000E45606A|nr:cytokine receptor family member B16 isoform X2 [Anabas testudineus]